MWCSNVNIYYFPKTQIQDKIIHQKDCGDFKSPVAKYKDMLTR